MTDELLTNPGTIPKSAIPDNEVIDPSTPGTGGQTIPADDAGDGNG